LVVARVPQVHPLLGLGSAKEAGRDALGIAARGLGYAPFLVVWNALRATPDQNVFFVLPPFTLWFNSFGATDVDLIEDLVLDPSEQSEKCYFSAKHVC